MKLSLKLRPTVEGRSSEISRLLTPPPLLYQESCLVKGEDGDPTKDKNSEDPSESASGEGGDDPDIDNNSNSTQSSRSSTPELPPPASPLLLPPPPPPPPLPKEEDMELMNKAPAPIMDISRTAISNPELIQGAEDEEDEAEEDMASSVATEEDAPLDFSVKRATEDESTDDDRSMTPNGLNPPSISQDGPLDLSVPRRRSSRAGDGPRQAKIAKLETASHMPSSPWGYNAPKHLPKTMVKATVAEVPMWNGKVKSEKRDKGHASATSSKHSSLNRSNVYNPLLNKNASPPLNSLKMSESRKNSAGSSKTDPYRPAGRQNPWQSQWMSRSSEQTRDVFTCVWCKESFRSLEDMTVHMKQSPRCGMAGMQTNLPATSPNSASVINHQHNHHQSPLPAKCSTSSSSAAGPAANAVIKENVSLPRKLVRGQDVWLGKGAEQTRQILKCMWCGQSFKTLADMTTHMRVTQHYTNIISQEQIISWRTPEDKMAAQSQVNAVLTCKVCDQAFGSLKELSYHMVKNSHYKEHILRSITEGGGRRRQTRERRKKSLPVRKLLELERMELNKQSPASSNDVINPTKNEVVDGKISCEECTEKVDAKDFVQHIKNCAQGSRSQQSVKSSPGSEGTKPSSVDINPDVPTTSDAGSAARSSPLASQELPADEASKSTGGQILQEDSMCDSVESTGSTSVLNAIEKLIEKSFESKGRRNAVSTGILQRLGIDEEVYPPWHPSSSPSAFGVLRSTVDMHRKSTSPVSRLHDFKMEMADFSGSESRSRSSSTSEKHPSFDEHLRLTFGISAKDVMNRVSTPSSASQSCSPVHFQPESPADERNSVFMSKEATNQASTSQAAALCSSSPKARSITPSSDRDHSEKATAKDSDQQEQQKEIGIKESEDLNSDDRDEKSAVSDDEQMVDCSREPTPKSEDRQTPLSRSSSCEPEMALAASPAASVGLESPDKHSKSIPKKKRNNSEMHRKSPSSSSKRRSHSHRKKSSEMSNIDGGCDSAMGSPTSTHSADVTSPRQKQHSDSAAGDHPLKELQKLLDKTDAHLSRPNLPATPGSILAFSWACSEATASDSLMKCAFCDTHFISKGAYRHHLSKMHFVKDGSLAEIAAASTWKPPSTSGNTKPNPSPGSSNGCGTSAAGTSRTGNNGSDPVHPASPQKELAPSAPLDESPHSKFLKYTELAKQLSSKYV
ncbi:protein tiptop-like isoform X1 [Argiope bruennichi]|uniref:Protein tiptop like protein n=1 Tax=Argiope bruennichi TaxID=94029 RepID=A0A8T0EW91_ARGBR|nr:protein tiptop-like isoform X1 [Argiope bruennichi]KAF8782605.1 Protein tiptop like protein [Argiope bruennichi]